MPKSPYVSSSTQNEHETKAKSKGSSTEDELADAPAELGPAAAAPEAAGQKAPKGWWTCVSAALRFDVAEKQADTCGMRISHPSALFAPRLSWVHLLSLAVSSRLSCSYEI